MSNMAALFLRVQRGSEYSPGLRLQMCWRYLISTDSNEVHTTIDSELSLVKYQNKVSSFEFEVQSS